ncbi:hypothetical protein [Mycolicibacterium fluoranthenivorans]|uniref:Uncharacterized protein n=1 Tax=Mycolicibacterium fluoranthenivorans TaxID=258505 RepID=A0A1G4W620_9MYCO|nr:hypothetical protein [Mycolicibacterium fluoranthenivorans]SCX17369.1 hypothetical protein SAMN02799620_02471 [Mycolicibacterium fluoranthenivorans]
MTVRLIGAWGNRHDNLQRCAERVQLSIELMPTEDCYGPWGVWESRNAASESNELVPIDLDDIAAVESAITSTTERVNAGPMTAPGYHIQFARECADRTADRRFFEYTVRAGFVGTPEPFNHLLLHVGDTDESTLIRYLSALVVAWEPDHLAAADRKVQRAQGHRPPEVLVGWLTYVRDDIPLNTDVIDEQIGFVARDGGRYITVAGTPQQPNLDHILQVRAALGYPRT